MLARNLLEMELEFRSPSAECATIIHHAVHYARHHDLFHPSEGAHKWLGADLRNWLGGAIRQMAGAEQTMCGRPIGAAAAHL